MRITDTLAALKVFRLTVRVEDALTIRVVCVGNKNVVERHK